MGATDEQCIERFLAGDAEAFSLLVARYGRSVMALALRLTGDRGAAEDLHQEVFIKAYRSARNLRDRSKFRAWLFTLATRHVRRYLRRRKGPVVATELVDNVEDGAESRDTLEIAEQVAALREQVAKLPPRQKEVVMLRGYEGLSYAEVARIMGGTAEGARANFYQALLRMRRSLQDPGAATDDGPAATGDRATGDRSR